ncbi:universal stress protein UspA-like protein [Mycolicibacterium chubuense NBB4]|uniref:Universal stress protein UspA-like protein n=1 Tax=Mycolicibacterium chubuense (strain NBB4) TaxID=710421 RepID=I4BIE4_MYCCN|nr:universal stress protein [Mycolicibacterium chubuense]AFM17051.1 universal stress protein UspA-like protein [Mycolicibacterium chubuense NBB4]
MLGANPAPSVVVGVDGSPAAVDAALWAIDEAIDRDIPLRLVYVIDSTGHDVVDPQDQARRMATADIAVRYVLTAVESTERPVKIEVEILQGRPVEALLEAARSATMLCVGARGLKHATRGRIGSTAAALAAAAQCPVAVVRAHKPHSAVSRAIVVEVSDNQAESAVLRLGLEEARRRGAPVRVLTPARIPSDALSRWERRLAEWRRHFPDVEVTSVKLHGDTLDYLAAHAPAIQLVVTDRGRCGSVGKLIGAPGNAALRDTDCSILVCDPHNAL